MPRIQFRLRTVLIAWIALALLLTYVGSYYRLSRRGLAEARKYGIKGIVYVDFLEAAKARDLRRHHLIAAFYAPANLIDRTFFGGDGPVDGILWGLSGSDPKK